jgi:fructokinase
MRIGIDLGGTKIEGVALSADGVELARQRVVTPRDSYVSLLASLTSMVTALETATASTGKVGVGTPGVCEPDTGHIVNSNLGILNGHDIATDLGLRLGRPIRVDNDANCFVLSEAIDGAASLPAPLQGKPLGHGQSAAIDVIFGATLGTGVGGGIVIDGRVLNGINGMAAEWSHTTLPFLRPGEQGRPDCFCGHQGCIESFVSGPALEYDYLSTTGHPSPGRAIVARAEAGNPEAAGTLARYEDRLARALAGVINLIDPRVIVLGGGLSDIPSLYQHVLQACERYTVAKHLRTQLVRARHGDASGARGAAWLWPLGLNEHPTT